MKKTASNRSRKSAATDLQAEYRFDYRKAKPNRFAGRVNEAHVVILDPDIAEVFTTSEAVNKALRALLAVIPRSAK